MSLRLLPILLLSLFLNSSSAIITKNDLFEPSHLIDPNPFALQNSSQTHPQGFQNLGYQINITIEPANFSNFDGLIFTTQQFSSLFPPMRTISPPQNVIFRIVIPLKPFKLLNFTGYKINVDFEATATVFLPSATGNQEWTKANFTGYLTIVVVDIFRGMHLQISDYQINKFIVPDSEKDKINVSNLFETFNGVGYLGVDYGNHVLGQKSLIAGSIVEGIRQGVQESLGDAYVTEDPEVVYHHRGVSVSIHELIN